MNDPALTKSVAKETAADGIIVSAMSPAAAETAMAMAREISAAHCANILSRITWGGSWRSTMSRG